MATATHTSNVEWHKGRDAFNAGDRMDSNPYSFSDYVDSRYARWKKGWNDADLAASLKRCIAEAGQ